MTIRGKVEFLDATSRFPCSQAVAKIAFCAGGGRVAVLSSLSEQLHDDRRDCVADCGLSEVVPLSRISTEKLASHQ